MGLVDQQEGAGPPRELSDGVEVPVVGQHDPDVGERRFEQDDRDVAILERAFEPVDVVELDDARRPRRTSTCGPIDPRRATPPVVVSTANVSSTVPW